MSVIARVLRRAEPDDALVIEPVRRRDLAEMLPIERSSYPAPWTPGVFESEIDLARRGERYYVVARRQGRLVGYAGLMFAVGDAHVTNIAVATVARRSGVATRLLAELAWEAIARSCAALTLEVRASNAGAIELYRRFGFAPVGVRQRYYENVEDAVVMWCHDIDGEAYRGRLADLCPEAARD